MVHVGHDTAGTVVLALTTIGAVPVACVTVPVPPLLEKVQTVYGGPPVFEHSAMIVGAARID